MFGYNQKCSFGLLTFDTTKTDPEVTYQIISIDDELIREFSLKKSQLAHGKAE
jgi:alkaline phosphatase D